MNRYIGIRIPVTTYNKLKRRANSQDRSLTYVIKKILHKSLNVRRT